VVWGDEVWLGEILSGIAAGVESGMKWFGKFWSDQVAPLRFGRVSSGQFRCGSVLLLT
jgi:hypothetical protein